VAGESARLFVALDLPAPVRDALLRWRAPLLAELPDALRPVPAEALHVTLCFLGARPLAAVDAIGETVRAVCRAVAASAGGGPGAADPGGAGALPGALALGDPLWLPRRRPHALSVAVADGDGALGALQGALAVALADGGWFSAEQRPFLPHVTVARVRRGGDPRALARRPLEGPVRASFAGAGVTLYRSHLGGGGARYEPLARVPS
jgi:2'-5' RNA ligase